IRVYKYNAGTYNLVWRSPKILACDVQIGNALNVSPSKSQILFSTVWWSGVTSSFDTCSAGWGVYAWDGATFKLNYFHQAEPNHWESWVGIADADNDGVNEIISAPGQIVLYQASGWTGVSSGSITPKRDAALFLNQNYPNPTVSFTTIEYSIPNNGFVKLNIYNTLGQLVKTAVNEQKKAGTYKFTWNGVNNDGQRVASGTYLYALEVDGKATTKKMVVLK
ncbi:MAG: FlgD immunoglobulin-like domain containing protein, partial [Candidatus Edwardsbacteria bacterium]|nr:FlgD immunoglobulin-like domain containing protein [Candidatus Edwardsbacteria bacterium]